MYKKQKHPFLHIGALEMGRVTLPQIFTDLYSLLRISVLISQKDLSTRNELTCYRKDTNLSTVYMYIPV